MKTLITGATGFVGSHVAELLVRQGHQVAGLARSPAGAEGLKRLGVSPVMGSLEDDAALRRALEGAELVVHAAGLTSGTEAELFAVNASGTERLIQLLQLSNSPTFSNAPTRFVYISSQAAVGPSPPGRPLDEEAECRPVTAYGRSKLAGERAVAASALAWTILRPPSVYGPRDREFLRLFRIARLGLAPVFGTGAQELSLVFAEDLARAVVAAATHPGAAGEVLHAAHPEIVRSRDVARAAARALGRRAVVVPLPALLARPLVTVVGRAIRAAGGRTVLHQDKLPELLAPSWLLQAGKAERLLGWRAETDLETGMARTAEWYRREGWL